MRSNNYSLLCIDVSLIVYIYIYIYDKAENRDVCTFLNDNQNTTETQMCLDVHMFLLFFAIKFPNLCVYKKFENLNS